MEQIKEGERASIDGFILTLQEVDEYREMKKFLKEQYELQKRYK